MATVTPPMLRCKINNRFYLYALYVLVCYVTNVNPVKREERLLRVCVRICTQKREKGGGRKGDDGT